MTRSFTMPSLLVALLLAVAPTPALADDSNLLTAPPSTIAQNVGSMITAGDVALVLTAFAGFITAGATALAGHRKVRLAERAAERAEQVADAAAASAARSERAFASLLKPTLYTAPPSEAQKLRFAAATKFLRAGCLSLTAAIRAIAAAPPEERGPLFAKLSTAHSVFSGQIVGLLPDRLFPEGAAVAAALGKVRLCATRAAGAASGTGSPAEWATEVESSLRAVELAIVTAITSTPEYAEEWLEISQRHQIPVGPA